MDKSRTWAARCVHEARLYGDENMFLTLTYRDDALVAGDFGLATLFPRHLELFWKRFRKAGYDVRYYAVGEYGDKTGRPHYHAIVFGLRFPDLLLHSYSNGLPIFSSRILDSLWTHGACFVGAVTFESCAYVARYVMKKLTGLRSSVYTHFGIHPEFARMSRRPGIGTGFYESFTSDFFPHDNCFIRNGKRVAVPRFYSDKYALTNPTEYTTIRELREAKRLSHADDNTPDRRLIKSEVKLHQLKRLLRSFE